MIATPPAPEVKDKRNDQEFVDDPGSDMKVGGAEILEGWTEAQEMVVGKMIPGDPPWCPLNGGPVTPGWRYQLAYHARGEGNFDIWDATNKAWVAITVRNSFAEANGYRQTTITFTAPEGCEEVWFAYRFTGDNTSYVDDVSMVWSPCAPGWADVLHRRWGNE